ncbi:hypothetical protein [Acidithiobacillus acidisediminis]|uniref:hypothetical protein n=1 Tax=Acidithiobacillus TaxID=119977 RepID=UPI00200D3BB4|nr:hypothetical protein [Acidithiobacillus sp. S30A2]MCL5051688.1 hypothetical protein [Gammaproteobacteria bacterium]
MAYKPCDIPVFVTVRRPLTVAVADTYGPSTKGDLIGLPGAPRTVYASLTANF